MSTTINLKHLDTRYMGANETDIVKKMGLTLSTMRGKGGRIKVHKMNYME